MGLCSIGILSLRDGLNIHKSLSTSVPGTRFLLLIGYLAYSTQDQAHPSRFAQLRRWSKTAYLGLCHTPHTLPNEQMLQSDAWASFGEKLTNIVDFLNSYRILILYLN